MTEKQYSISHALDSLQEAAKESSEGIRQMISKDYGVIKDKLNNLKPEVEESIQELKEASTESVIHLKDRIVDTSKGAAELVDTTIRRYPWTFIGGTAAVVGLVGYFLGRASRSRDHS